MACSCIERIQAELQEETGDIDAYIENVTYDFEEARHRLDIKVVFYSMCNNRKYIKNNSVNFVKPEYCPFCGVKYNEEAENG